MNRRILGLHVSALVALSHCMRKLNWWVKGKVGVDFLLLPSLLLRLQLLQDSMEQTLELGNVGSFSHDSFPTVSAMLV